MLEGGLTDENFARIDEESIQSKSDYEKSRQLASDIALHKKKKQGDRAAITKQEEALIPKYKEKPKPIKILLDQVEKNDAVQNATPLKGV